MLSDHNLTQLVNVPTHKCGHILDWVVVRTENSCFCFDSVQDYPDLSDHVRDRPSALWMAEEIREARRRRRLAERRWRATRLTVHREIYAKAQAAVKACVQEAKRRFYCEKIDSSSSCRQLFAVSSELSGKSSTAPLPSDIPRSDLPDQFCDFFSDKIDRIRDDLDSRSCEPPTFAIFDGPQLSQFEPVTDELIRELS